MCVVIVIANQGAQCGALFPRCNKSNRITLSVGQGLNDRVWLGVRPTAQWDAQREVTTRHTESISSHHDLGAMMDVVTILSGNR